MKVILLGAGFVASTLVAGIEKIKRGEAGCTGIPLGNELPIKPEDISIIGAYDVDTSKIDTPLSNIVARYWSTHLTGETNKIKIRKGIHLGSLNNIPIKASGREEKKPIRECIEEIIDEWVSYEPDVIVNLCTTESFGVFPDEKSFMETIHENNTSKLTATQVYFYTACLYAKTRKRIAFVNAIPTPLANDPVMLNLAEKHNLVVLGDDGASGATPLSADILAHQAQRNRTVKDIAQFNIGGNMDFLALTDEGRNKSKEVTKSSIVEDILGYNAPHYIKPTGYIESLGDKKFVALHIEYESFNGVTDEIMLTARINDSPALAGLLVDLVRLAKIAIERGISGTVYEINAFYMKRPGPVEKPNIPRIIAYERLRSWCGLNPKW